MNLTLSIEDQLVQEARQVAESMGKSLNQMLREYLEQLTARNVEADLAELDRLSDLGAGRSRGWKFNREELHERS